MFSERASEIHEIGECQTRSEESQHFDSFQPQQTVLESLAQIVEMMSSCFCPAMETKADNTFDDRREQTHKLVEEVHFGRVEMCATMHFWAVERKM